MSKKIKISIITGSIALTLAIHYGYILEPLFGNSHWIHAVHGRFCYIPIVIASAWFGLGGGLFAASAISMLVLPYILTSVKADHNLSGEFVEIFFYFAIAFLSGALIDREMFIRRKHEQTQLHLERSQKLSIIGQIAAGVAHEVKNPLASIKGAVEIIGDKKTDEKSKKEFLELASQEIKRIDSSIKEFLQFARPKESKMEKISLSETVDKAVKQMEVQALSGHKTLKASITPNLYINGDSEKIHQVILNIVINSLEATSFGGQVELGLMKKNAEEISLIIKDNGRGIPADKQDKIFEPFYSSKSSGSGLGLAIVRSIIENHNGEIEIDSQENIGTSVMISLPVYKVS